MGGHSDPAVEAPISADQALAVKLQEILGTLQARTADDFRSLLGVPIPRDGDGPILVGVEDDSLISVEKGAASVVAEFEAGAARVVSQMVADPAVKDCASRVVGSVLGLVGQNGVEVGGYAASGAVRSGGTWVSAVLCTVEAGSRQDWGTPVDFFIVSFVFEVWRVAAQAALSDEPAMWTHAASHWAPES